MSEGRLAGLLGRYDHLSECIESIKQMLAVEERKLETLVTQEIPDALLEAGLSEATLADGRKLTLRAFNIVRIRKAQDGTDQEAMNEGVYRWLEETGQAHLLTHELSLKFKRDQDALCQTAQDILDKAGLAFDEKRGLHWKILESYVQAELEAGRQVPRDLLEVTPIRRAEIG